MNSTIVTLGISICISSWQGASNDIQTTKNSRSFKVVDFLPPFLLDHLAAYMAPKMEKDVFQFLKPFDSTLWILIISTMLIFTIIKFVLSYTNQNGYIRKKGEIFSRLKTE